MAKPTRMANRIRQLKVDQNAMTQAEIAEQVGVTRQTVNPIEKGKYSPSLEVAFPISRALGRRLDDVFDYLPD